MIRALLLTLFFAATTFAQNATQQNPRPACDGKFATVRISELTPNGTVDGFLKAVAAHQQWYDSHGMPGHQIYAARTVVRDAQTHAQSYSEKQIMTFHVEPKERQKEAEHDAAYDSFVKMYRDNSNITQTYNICLPQ